MPIIQREKISFEGREFARTTKVNSSGEFSVALPPPVAAMFGFGIVTGATKKDAIAKFDEHVRQYTASQSTSKRVILYRVFDEIAFADGLALAVTAREYIETKRTTADGGALFDYKPVDYSDKTLDTDLYARNNWELTPNGRVEAEHKIDWTPERAQFLNKIAKALSRIKDELRKLEDPAALIRIAETGRFLEDSGK